MMCTTSACVGRVLPLRRHSECRVPSPRRRSTPRSSWQRGSGQSSRILTRLRLPRRLGRPRRLARSRRRKKTAVRENGATYLCPRVWRSRLRGAPRLCWEQRSLLSLSRADRARSLCLSFTRRRSRPRWRPRRSSSIVVATHRPRPRRRSARSHPLGESVKWGVSRAYPSSKRPSPIVRFRARC